MQYARMFQIDEINYETHSTMGKAVYEWMTARAEKETSKETSTFHHPEKTHKAWHSKKVRLSLSFIHR